MRLLRIAAVQLAIAFALLEVLLRVYNPIPFRVRGDRIVLPVKQVYEFDNAGARKLDPTTVHTKNSLGFRGPEPPAGFAGRPTVLTIGGSTTECLFLGDGKTWTDAMAATLAKHVPDVWVNNAGIDGHSTFGHLILLRSFVLQMRPQVAVFLVGTNDVGLEQSNTHDSGVVPTGDGFRRAVSRLSERSEVITLVQNFVRANQARRRGLGHSEVDLRTAEHLVLDESVMRATEDQHREFLPGYADRLRQIAALTRGAGIEPVWVTQPALFGDVVDPATGVALGEVKVNGRGNGRLEWRLLEMYNDVTRKVAADEAVLLIDLARELPKDSRYFYDFLHFTNEGAKAVGEIVARELLKAEVLRK